MLISIYNIIFNKIDLQIYFVYIISYYEISDIFEKI